MFGDMSSTSGQIPPGPQEEYRTTEDLLGWMSDQFQKFGDIYKASAYGSNVYVIRDPAFAYHVLVENWQNYIKGQFIKRVAFLLGNGLMVSEGGLWKRQRRMIQPSFHPKSIPALIELSASVNFALLDKWRLAAQKRDGINVTREVSGMALEIILRSLLGRDYEQAGSYFNLLTEETARNLTFAQSFRALGKIILQVVARRRTDSMQCSDLLGALTKARDAKGQPMDDRQLVSEALTLIVAGHETTASTLNWTWYLISQHPEVEQRLSDELSDVEDSSGVGDPAKFPYGRRIIEEAMRLYPAGWLMTRKALRDDHLGYYFVPAGTEIYIPLYFIQRHPDLWEEPDSFNPDRFQPDQLKSRHRLSLMPFSSGPRNCIGSHFARAEMLIHLTIVAKHLRLRYVQSGPIDLDPGVNLRSKYDFIMYPELKPRRKLI